MPKHELTHSRAAVRASTARFPLFVHPDPQYDAADLSTGTASATYVTSDEARAAPPTPGGGTSAGVHGAISRAEAERLLASAGLAVGLHLVRSKGEGAFVLTVCVDAAKPVFAHHVLQPADQGQGFTINGAHTQRCPPCGQGRRSPLADAQPPAPHATQAVPHTAPSDLSKRGSVVRGLDRAASAPLARMGPCGARSVSPSLVAGKTTPPHSRGLHVRSS